MDFYKFNFAPTHQYADFEKIVLKYLMEAILKMINI